MTTDYTGLVEFIVKNIVENPESVVVDGNSRRHRSQTVEVRLDPADVGRVIGKGGKNIEAIRSVVKAAAIKDHTRVNVEVITEDDDRGDDGYRDQQAGEGVPEPQPESGTDPEAHPAGAEIAPQPVAATVDEHPAPAGGTLEE